MNKVVSAAMSNVDPRFPIMLVGMSWWEKLSVEEAEQLISELRLAIDMTEIKEAA
jgi:hypothetical protein